MRTIQQSWESYFESVLPEEAGIAQINEAKAAFYGGAIAALSTFADICNDESVSEEAGLGVMEGLISEVNEFVRSAEKNLTTQ